MIKKNSANILTLLNISLGVLSIAILQQHGKGSDCLSTIPLQYAGLLILLAAFLDRFDGKLARRYNSVSDFGKQLDSLCDLVSFGVAPSLLLWSVLYPVLGAWILPLLFLYPLAGAVRLARFNLQEDTSYFVGLPITVAGALVALFSSLFLYFFSLFRFDSPLRLFLALLLYLIGLLLSYCMVASFKIKKR